MHVFLWMRDSMEILGNTLGVSRIEVSVVPDRVLILVCIHTAVYWTFLTQKHVEKGSLQSLARNYEGREKQREKK